MTIRRIAIIGAGTMGAGIAITTATAEIETTLIDRDPASLQKASDRFQHFLARAVEKGRMTDVAAEQARQRLRLTTDLSETADCDLVIEAVFEKLAIKTALMRELDAVVSPDCILATNTSCLRVSEIGDALHDASRFVGLHYFSPAEINPVVEVVLGKDSNPSLLSRILQFLRQTGKVALPCKDRHGFAINRFFCPTVNEAVRCYEEDLASPAQIDAIACALFEQAIGPFATTNIVGPVVMLHALENLSHLGAFYAPAVALRRLTQSGQKWEIGQIEAAPSDAARKEIIARLRAALYLPISQLLAEKVATPQDIDRGAHQALRMGLAPAASFLAMDADARQAVLAPMHLRYGTIAESA